MTETRRTSARLNDFPIRSFRDIADDDYIAARLAFRSMLVPQFLWSSLQALEKYLKCILVLNCVQAKRGHDLRACLTAFEQANLFDLRITAGTHKFIDYLDTYGRHRYFETPFYVRGLEILSLDRAVWEIRRYAQVLRYELNVDGRLIPMLPPELRRIEAAETRSPHMFTIMGARLEKIIADAQHPAREPLLWQNIFYGKRPRKTIRIARRTMSANSPLSMHPEILDQVMKYVFLPSDVVKAYRAHATKRA